MACRWTKEASEATTSEEDNQIFQGNVNFRALRTSRDLARNALKIYTSLNLVHHISPGLKFGSIAD